jgi:small subunit ribosomal protein S15Ae
LSFLGNSVDVVSAFPWVVIESHFHSHISFLRIMKDRGYINDFLVYDPHRVGRITVQLQGRINDCWALTYRQDIKARDIENYRVSMLPTHQWGYVVITTPDGVLDHEEAIKRDMGGRFWVIFVRFPP